MSELSDIKILLSNIQNLIAKNEEIAKLKGENFNIFSILGMSSKEYKLHSKFIGELLDVKGSHGMGNIFLNLFIEHLKNITKDIHFNINESTIKLEESIGKNDIENALGGRLDILLFDNIHKIIIENKIYSGEGDKQIERYCNYAKENNALVFYLTLLGDESESSGDYESGEDYYLLSYSEDIIKWLEQCRKAAIDFPLIRETIKQYINTLKKLTGQLTDSAMNETLKHLILDNYYTAFQIADSFKNIERDILEFWNKIGQEIIKNDKIKSTQKKISKRGSELIIDLCDFSKNYIGVFIKNINNKPLYCVEYRSTKFNEETVKKYLKGEGLNWNRGNIMYEKDLDIDFSKPENIKIIFNAEEKQDLISKFSNEIVQFISENEEFIIAISKLKIKD